MADRVHKQRTPVSTNYSPTPGCIIFVIGIVGILGLVGWFLYAGYRQSQEIRGFTDDKAAAVAAPAPAGEVLKAVQEKIAAFGRAVQEKSPASLTLSTAELNALLGGDATLASIRETIRVEGISEKIRAAVCLPLNTFGQKRFLNGSVEFAPVIKPGQGLSLETAGISVPGRTVSEGFIKLYRDMNFLDDMLLKPYREHPQSGPPIKATTEVKCINDQVVLSFAPNKS